MSDYFLIKNVKKNTFFTLKEIDKKNDQAIIDFADMGKAIPLNETQVEYVLEQLKAEHPDAEFEKVKVEEKVAGIMANSFDLNDVIIKEEIEKHRNQLITKFKAKINDLFVEMYRANPHFKILTLDKAIDNLIHVGLSQIEDNDYSSYKKRLERMLDKKKVNYFNMYALLVEVGIKSLLKEARSQ